MDLLAILTSQNISIFRPLSSNFENYLFKPPLKQFQFLCFSWRRDGKCIALLSSNKKICKLQLLHLETNQFIYETTISFTSISQSCWTTYTNTTSLEPYQSFKKFLLLPPSRLPEYVLFTNTIQFPSAKEMEEHSETDQQEILWNPNILCTLGKEEQSIECRALGTFFMGTIHIKGLSSSIEKILLQSNLKHLVCVLKNKKQIVVLHVEDLIANHWKQWYFVAQHWTSIDVPLNSHIKSLMEMVEKCWTQFYKQFLLLFEEFYEMTSMPQQQVFGIKTEKQEEEETISKFSKVTNCLLLILSIGTFDQPTLKWLSEVVTEQKMQRIITSMDLTRKNITTCVMDYLLRYLEQIMFHLTSIKGCIASDSKFSDIGIDSPSISQLIEMVSSMAKEMKLYLTDLNEQCRQIRNFIDWIRETSAKVDNISKEEQQMRQQQLPISNIQIKELTSFLIHFPKQHMSIAQQFKTIKLNMHPQLVKGFEQVFHNVSNSFSNYDSNLHSMTIHFEDTLYLQSTKLFQDPLSDHLVIGVQCSNTNKMIFFSLLEQLRYCVVELPEYIVTVHGWEWYTMERILIVWKGKQEEEKISILTVPWNALQHLPHTSSVIIQSSHLNIVTSIQELDSSRVFQYNNNDNISNMWLHTSTIRGLASVYSCSEKMISIFDLETPEEEEEEQNMEE